MMEKRFRVAVVVIMVMALLTNPILLAWGNPPPGRWEKVAQLEPGQKMVVYTDDGGKKKYSFQSLDEQFLMCRDKNDQEVQIEHSSVTKIVIPKAGKYAAWGSLYGAAGGSLITLATPWNGSDGPYGGMILGGAIGAVSGLLAGAAIGAPGETIFISKEAAQDKAN